ncbi:MAG: folylpolyglutamate synthase/dihydrofolate synthase family protein [Chthoniobacteraceae bacterium]
MTYREAVAWLYGQQLHGIRLGLETMQRLCVAVGVDLAPTPVGRGKAAPALSVRRSTLGGSERPFFIHVAGTNGKGSVCAMLDAIYRAAGFRTGLYTSPHLVTFRERIRLDGAMIPEADVAAGLTEIRNATAQWDEQPTFFEIATALALGWFQDERAQVVVLETGLGGRLDATNVVVPAVSVLTPIDLDHQHYLGDTITKIAAEKCGIIKPGVPVVSALQWPEAREVIERTAAARECALHEVVDEVEPRLPVSLTGTHQHWNAALARTVIEVAAVHTRFLSVPAEAVAKGLASVGWPGRFQRVGGRIVLDGAHNPAAAATLAHTWREVFGAQKATLILAAMRDKDTRGVCAELTPIAARVFTVRVENARSCTAEELAAIAQPAQAMPSLAAAIEHAKTHAEPILIAGSLFLVGEALVALGLAESEGERSEQ